MWLRILKYTIIALIVTYGFGWFYYNDGAVKISWMDYEIETTIAFSFFCIAISFLVISGFYNSLIYIVRLPFQFLENRRIKNELDSLKKLQIANYFLHKQDYDFAENFINKRPNGYVLHEDLTRALLLKAQGNFEAVGKILEKFKNDPDLKNVAKSIEIEMSLSSDFALGRAKLNEELERLDVKKDAQYFLDNICQVAGSYLLNNEVAEGTFWYEKATKVSSKNFKVKLTEILIALKTADLKKAKKLVERTTYIQNHTVAVDFLAEQNKKNAEMLARIIGNILVGDKVVN